MEIGISTFGEVAVQHLSGGAIDAQQRVAQLIEEAKLADELGLDVFALGEHHRPDYVVSAPEIVLAGIASVTKKIKLSSAVTVLSSADPVRVYQNFATLDLISNGRAEIMAGRGSFIESFPLFGYELDDYNELFSEKLALLLQINEHEVVRSKGVLRASIEGAGIYPRAIQNKLPIWIAVGGTPSSVVRAATLGLPLTVAILGGNPVQFTQLTNLYKQTYLKAGHNERKMQLAINQHMYVAASNEQAADEYWPIYSAVMNRVGKERGWQPMTRAQFDYMCGNGGSLLVGSPEHVANKMIAEQKYFGNTRFLAQCISSTADFERQMNSIQLFASKVAPIVKEQVGQMKSVTV